MENFEIILSRPSKSTPWGFSIQGGKDFGCPLSVLKITRNSIAEKNGIQVQDFILAINDLVTSDLTHQQAISQIQNLNIKLVLKRGLSNGNDSLNLNSNCKMANELPPPPPEVNVSNRFSTDDSSFQPPLPPPPPPPLVSLGINSNSSSNLKNAGMKVKSNTELISKVPPVEPYNSNSVNMANKIKINEEIKSRVPVYQPSDLNTNNSTVKQPLFQKNVAPSNVDQPARQSTSATNKIPTSSINLANLLQNVTPPNVDQPARQSTSATNKIPTASTNLANLLQNVAKPPSESKTSKGRDNRDLVILGVDQDKSVAICVVCKDHIRGGYIEANGKIYCSNHFCCSYCKNPISGSQFLETKEGTLYCLEDYKNHIAPRCARCSDPIIEQQVKALGKSWHPFCFSCDYCKQPIPHGSFHINEDDDGMKIYCEADYKAFFEVKCFACKFPIEADEKYVQVSGNNYHTNCYKR